MSLIRLLLVILALSLPGVTRAQEPTNFQGLWWASPPGSEPGWGLNIAHQGDVLFATLFTYNFDGSRTWVVMPDMRRVGATFDSQGRLVNVTYSGGAYVTTGPAYNAATFDPNQVQRFSRGTWFLHFSSDNQGVLESFEFAPRAITRQLFASPVPTCALGGAPGAAPNYTDLWWASPPGSESGWGINLTHQGDVIFATWFTYGPDTRPVWFVMSELRRTPNGSYAGPIYRTQARPGTMTTQGGQVIDVGTGTFIFTDPANGTFAYIVDGFSASKRITRQLFASPQTVCR